jgi:Xaa-Pro aminopeptidase
MGGLTVAVDQKRSPVWFGDALKESGAKVIDAKDPAVAPKARKNKAEQAAMRRAHIRDGVAIVKFLKWFSKAALKETLTEMEVSEKLESFRAEAPEYRGPSFDTIAGFGPNGAIIHYRATPQTGRKIEKWNFLLLDSGAQYLDGTTDITRTIAVGQPSQIMKNHYTFVLKAHIAVAAARFPKGTTGAQIDALARAQLWQHDLDYAHGTGHGVGCYLSVHEEAASLSPRGQDPVEAGMILSNEPGYYKAGDYGIRLENLLLAFEDGSCNATEKPMLAFETLTFAPFDRNAMNLELLTPDEKFWIANYHKKVFSNLSAYLDDETKNWLYDQTHG